MHGGGETGDAGNTEDRAAHCRCDTSPRDGLLAHERGAVQSVVHLEHVLATVSPGVVWHRLHDISHDTGTTI